MHENQRALGTRIKHSAWDFCTFPPLPYRHGVIRQIRQLFGTAWTLATSHVLDIVSTCCFSFFFSSTYNFVLVACKSVRQTPWMRYASYPISKTARESVSSALKHHHSISKKKKTEHLQKECPICDFLRVIANLVSFFKPSDHCSKQN